MSAPSPALMAQRKVLLLGKLQVDHWTPPYVLAELEQLLGGPIHHFGRPLAATTIRFDLSSPISVMDEAG